MISVEQARTLDGLFYHRVRRSPERIAYRHFDRKASAWRALTWHEAGRQVARWCEALANEGLQPGDRVAMLLRNCPEWVIFDQAAFALGLVTVPLYTDDRPENAVYVCQDAGIRLLLVQDAGRWRRISAALGDQAGPARILLLDANPDARRLSASDPRVVVAEDWLPPSGTELRQRDGDPHDLATIVYTSGTTGRPKGVMLSHHNILWNASASLAIIECHPDDLFLSFLPLSHTLERTGGCYLPMMAGASVAYARSVGQLGEDLQAIRPTAMIAVPRVFERVYQRLHEQVQHRPWPLRLLFRLAQRVGWQAFERSQGRRGWTPLLLLWPLLRGRVAKPVLDRLGGRLRIAVSGGAPLPGDVAHLFIGLGLPLLQGYGLTETSPVISVNALHDNCPESVGIPLPGIDIRVGDDDELLVKGPGNMLGYWRNPSATASLIDPNGWLHTGDQVRIANNHLYIIGRIKDILVLSNGEKIPPADMEMAISLDPLVEQVIILGEGRPFLSALLVLNLGYWRQLAADYDLDPEAPESLTHPQLLKDMLKRLRDRLSDFPGYAKIRRVALTLEPWSVDNDLLTPTMKIRRRAVLQRHAGQIETIYRLEQSRS